MAVVDRNSTQIANRVATPAVRNDSTEADAAIRSALGYVANAADDSATSVHRVVSLPSHCNVRSIKLSTGDATTAGAFDLGAYYSDDHPDDTLAGTVIDADYFATAFDLTGGPFTKQELINESGTNTLAKQQQPLWKALGLSEDPGGLIDLAVTVSTTYNGASVGQLFEVVYAQ